MAVVWIKPIRATGGKSIAGNIADRIEYILNPDKTDGGNLVVGYACHPATAPEEFMLAKKEYGYLTGRTQSKRNVLIYHIRQSFKPGEVDAEALCCRGCFQKTLLLQYGSHVIRSSLRRFSRKGAMPEIRIVHGATFAMYSLDTNRRGKYIPRSPQAATRRRKERKWKP